MSAIPDGQNTIATKALLGVKKNPFIQQINTWLRMPSKTRLGGENPMHFFHTGIYSTAPSTTFHELPL